MRKQREEDDFWDEYEGFRSESSFYESNFVESSLDGCSSDEENLDGREEGGRGDSIEEGLGGGTIGGEYLRGIRGCEKNVNDVIKERWKNRLLEPGQLLICFQLSLRKFCPKMNMSYLLLYLLLLCQKVWGKKQEKHDLNRKLEPFTT